LQIRQAVWGSKRIDSRILETEQRVNRQQNAKEGKAADGNASAMNCESD